MALIRDSRQADEVEWQIALFTLAGEPLGPLQGLTERKLNFSLNGLDRFEATMRLEHSRAHLIHPLSTVIKVWRIINRDNNPNYYRDINTRPAFCGIVGPIAEDGASQTFTIAANSPFWRLRYRFVHQFTRYEGVDQSRILQNLIDYTNARGYTGIDEGNLQTTFTRDRQYDRESAHIWQQIQNMTGVINGIDIYPTYVHTDGDPTHVLFNTAFPRGGYLEEQQIHYRLLKNNAENTTREFNIEEFANYVVGTGSSDGSAADQVAEDTTSQSQYGLYETIQTYDNVVLEDTLLEHAQGHLEVSKDPREITVPTIAVGRTPLFGRDFNVGDVLPVRAKRGRLDVAADKRVYEVTLNMSNEGMETAEVTVDDDTSGLIVP